MKLYTNQDQTEKLIELGFPRPQGWGNIGISNKWVMAISPNGEREDFNYSIGDLIEFLPRRTTHRGLEIVAESDGWLVMHGHDPFDPQCKKPELIDALYEYCVKLKNEVDEYLEKMEI